MLECCSLYTPDNMFLRAWHRYGGGRPGMSDTLVGGLWVADALFAFAKAGAKAFHLHWGIGGHPTGQLGQPNTGVQTNFYYKYKGKTYEYKDLMALRVS